MEWREEDTTATQNSSESSGAHVAAAARAMRLEIRAVLESRLDFYFIILSLSPASLVAARWRS